MIKAPGSKWWWRLQLLQWIQSRRITPVRSIAKSLAWWTPWVFAPLALLLSGPGLTRAGLEFVLSLDVPLALAMAAATALNARGIESRRSSEDWLWPQAFRPARLRWLSRLRWLLVVRWPAGLAIAAALLTSGADATAGALMELLVMAALGFFGGATFVWALRRRSSSSPYTPAARPRLARGMAALSWVALHESRERFNLQRAAILAVPAMLAAPTGALAGDVAKMVAVWLPLLFVVEVFDEAARTSSSVRRWLPASPALLLTWWIWRYLALAVALTAALLWMGTGLRTSGKHG